MATGRNPQSLIPSDGTRRREFHVYWKGRDMQLNYIGRAFAQDAHEALVIVLTLKYQSDLENVKIVVAKLDEDVWQAQLEGVEYIIKGK